MATLPTARSIVMEYTGKDDAWAHLVQLRTRHGRGAVLGYLVGVGVPPEVIARVMRAVALIRRLSP